MGSQFVLSILWFRVKWITFSFTQSIAKNKCSSYLDHTILVQCMFPSDLLFAFVVIKRRLYMSLTYSNYQVSLNHTIWVMGLTFSLKKFLVPCYLLFKSMCVFLSHHFSVWFVLIDPWLFLASIYHFLDYNCKLTNIYILFFPQRRLIDRKTLPSKMFFLIPFHI